MRKLLIALTIILVILSIVFIILPMENLTFLPVTGAFVVSIITIHLSKDNQKLFPKYLFLASLIVFLAVVAKDVFVKDQVISIQQLDAKKEVSK